MKRNFINNISEITNLTTLEFIEIIEALDKTVNEMYGIMIGRFSDCKHCHKCKSIKLPNVSEDMQTQLKDLDLCIHSIAESIMKKEVIYTDK